MKNKKLLIIIAIVILAGIIAYFLLKPESPSAGESPSIPDNELTSEQLQVKQEASQAIDKLQNFTDNTTEEYLNSIKPYSSDQFFEDQKELAEVQKEFNKKQGFASSQKYSISKIELVESDNEDGEILTYKITGTREYKDSSESDVTYLKYQKIEGQWKIIDILPEN